MSYFKYQTHEEILKLFAESEIACLPSQWEEPFGRVVMESMAMSCATITSNRGGIPEITGDSALVIEPSVKNLKNAMIKLITDHDFRRELQVKGRQRIQKKFDSEMISNKIDRIREDLIR